MCYLPRALFFSVPALILLVGSYLVSPKDLKTEAEAQPSSSLAASIEWPTERNEALIRRVALKQETTLDLLDGRITFHESVDRFRLLSTSANSNSEGAGDDARFAAQVVSFSRAETSRNPGRFKAALADIELAARSMERSSENSSPPDSCNPQGS